MGDNFQISNLNAQAIFQILNSKDSDSSDSKIDSNIWNEFAQVAGGNKIKNYIEYDKAISAINRYLDKAPQEVKESICLFLNKNIEENSYAQLTQNLSGQDAEREIKNITQTANNKNINGYNFSVNDMKEALGYTFELKQREIGTSEIERQQALNAKAPSGRTYIEAKKIVSTLEKKYLSQKPVTFGLATAENNRYGEINRRFLSTSIVQYMSEEDKKLYMSAQNDINVLTAKYPNIQQCAEDLYYAQNQMGGAINAEIATRLSRGFIEA